MEAAPHGLRLSDLNRVAPEAFVRALGSVFENSPWVAEVAAGSRPFADVISLHQAMIDAVRAQTPERQIELLKAHPELAGRLARAGTLTAASTNEQSSAGLDRLGPTEYRRFDQLNAAYRAKFGFPFIIAVRGHTKQSILESFEVRLGYDADRERATALDEVFKITRMRLEHMIEPG